tara:strand:- start:241 stop:453 length:213 start_codon:yes stop_codon:yes gene_type:complete
MKYLCTECKKIYPNLKSIKKEEPDKIGLKFLGVVVMVCKCGAKNRFRPENHWDEKDKQIYYKKCGGELNG